MTESMKDTFERHAPKLYKSKPNYKRVVGPITNEWSIPTLEGTMRADVGDYIIEGLRGEYYPCKPDIFAKSYDAQTFLNRTLVMGNEKLKESHDHWLEITRIINDPGIEWKVRRALLREKFGFADVLIDEMVGKEEPASDY